MRFCPDCSHGKDTVLPFPVQSMHRSIRPLQLLHTDLCGPLPVMSYGNAKYFVTFIDDATRMLWVRFLNNKSELYTVFTELVIMLENMCGYKLGTLRSDRGGEYLSAQMTDFLKSRGIQRQLAVADAHQQNGVAERMNRTIMDRVRSMLSESGASKKLWAEAFNCVAYVRNRCPTLSLPNDSSQVKSFTGVI